MMFSIVRRIRKVHVVVVATAAVLAAGATAASAAELREPSGLKDPCGYLGWAKYRHCDGGTGSTVMLDVEDIWGNIHTRCVGPGVTDLQPGIRWAVTGAWWNGGVGCIPGINGSDSDLNSSRSEFYSVSEIVAVMTTSAWE